MRVLVCGSRRATTNMYPLLSEVLNELDKESHIDIIIEGGSSGIDRLAWTWAQHHERTSITCRAQWATRGRAAGPERNKRMLDGFMPHVVVAMPGGKGTNDMVNRAHAANVRVIDRRQA